ncbi:hypothetical protein, partial [Novipirellula maiorica]|uniref:hypothetical protein n=1 Tax=Novipirellula maiorica TaxID=1265734 RepID=UPI001F1F8BA7
TGLECSESKTGGRHIYTVIVSASGLCSSFATSRGLTATAEDVSASGLSRTFSSAAGYRHRSLPDA